MSATVDAAPRRSAKLVNAVLRRLASDGEPPGQPPWVTWSHPRELWLAWSGRFGEEAAISLMRWNNTPPPIGGCMAGGRPRGAVAGRFLDDYFLMERRGDLRDGAVPEGVYIQDEGAAVVGRGLARLPGDAAVETCAAPGGKTVHLDACSRLVVSMDSSMRRMAGWVENSARLGWGRSLPVIADARHLPVARAPKVVVDAPCTATGVYRRRNDARWGFSRGLLDSCVSLQRSLLAEAASATAPGGVLAYSTCSIEPEEGVRQVEWFEGAFPGFRRLPFPADPVLVRDGMLCIFPPEHSLDGHFAACWERSS